MEDLLHGDTRWLASAITVAPVPTGVPGGITSEEEEEQLDSLNEWIAAAGLPRGVVAYDFSDTESGEQKAVFDLVWPNGIQEELSQPVAVLLNEEVQTLALASQAGFPVFHGRRRVQALRHRRDPRRGCRGMSVSGRFTTTERLPALATTDVYHRTWRRWTVSQAAGHNLTCTTSIRG